MMGDRVSADCARSRSLELERDPERVVHPAKLCRPQRATVTLERSLGDREHVVTIRYTIACEALACSQWNLCRKVSDRARDRHYADAAEEGDRPITRHDYCWMRASRERRVVDVASIHRGSAPVSSCTTNAANAARPASPTHSSWGR